jgi:hypothetical protein
MEDRDMLSENDRRRLKNLKSDARISSGKIRWANVTAWRVGMSFQLTAGEPHWCLSAQLLDRTQSTEEDWADLGRITSVVGPPTEPMFPIKDTPPGAVHHYQWFETPDGPMSLAGVIPAGAVKDYGAAPTVVSCIACGGAGYAGMACNLCNKKYVHCRAHQGDSETAMRGHILRVHPESVPSVVDQLMKNETELAAMRKHAEGQPELWAKLFAYIATRKI